MYFPAWSKVFSETFVLKDWAIFERPYRFNGRKIRLDTTLTLTLN